jgi:hypothetical protein
MAGDPTLSHRREEIRQRGITMAALIAVLVVVLRYVPLTSELLRLPHSSRTSPTISPTTIPTRCSPRRHPHRRHRRHLSPAAAPGALAVVAHATHAELVRKLSRSARDRASM